MQPLNPELVRHLVSRIARSELFRKGVVRMVVAPTYRLVPADANPRYAAPDRSEMVELQAYVFPFDVAEYSTSDEAGDALAVKLHELLGKPEITSPDHILLVYRSVAIGFDIERQEPVVRVAAALRQEPAVAVFTQP